MDATAAAGSLIAPAAKWGHPAVAITDHGGAQAFPAAFGAPNKIQKFADTLGRTLLAAQHQVRNARNLADFGFERPARVAQQA